MPPFPPSGKYIQSIRQTSRSLREKAGISINPDTAKKLLLSPAFTTSFRRLSSSHGLAFPLKFSSPLDELNFLSILSLLNFASGYRFQLHTQLGRGAWDSITALVFSSYISSSADGVDRLSAKGLAAFTPDQVTSLLGVNLYIERPHEMVPGLTVGELDGSMHELVNLITQALNETGNILIDLGYPNLGTFVAEALKEGAKSKSTPDASYDLDVVLERIVHTLPAFQDMAEVYGQPIYCFKKALFLIHAIFIRFGSLSSPPFSCPSTVRSPVFTDNVLPSMLIHFGVIDLSSSPELSALFPGAGSPEIMKTLFDLYDGPQSPSQVVPREGPVLTPSQAYTLRAAAIDACELIIDVARSLAVRDIVCDGSLDWVKEITLPDLDIWIWAVAKDRPDYRRLERFVLKNTLFF